MDTTSLPLSYMAGNCQNVRFWNFGHDCYLERDELPLAASTYLSQNYDGLGGDKR